MTTYNLKTQFQNILRPVAYKVSDLGISPNQITISACLLSLIYAAIVIGLKEIYWVYYLFPLMFLIRMGLNAMDGIIANEKNKKSQLGAILNELCDVVSDAMMIGVFLFTSNANSNLIWMFIYLSLFVECAGMWSFYISGQRSYLGPLGKSDRGIILSAMAIITGFSIKLNWHFVHTVLNTIVMLAIVLLVLTVINRIRVGLSLQNDK
jgi:CDP-diacylglycerol--glycerol-3-phosphate 3-phosphatidyltransferase